MRWKRFIIFMIMIALASPVMLMGDADAKRKKRSYKPSLKILDISTSPTPYTPGNGPLAITIDVGLPKNLTNVDLLEISSMISFLSKRSIRFLYSRHRIEEAVISSGKQKITTTLLWDGKDQTNQLVSPGTYKYEIRAKLMSNTDGPPRTKIVSLRARGKLEVSSPESLANSGAHLEHVPMSSDNIPSEEINASSNVPIAEAEVSEVEGIGAQEHTLEETVTENADVSVSGTP
jgi:hypothetical protein